MPERSKLHTFQNCQLEFARVDQVFNALGFTEENKITIFKLLASILHLGNVEFGNGNDDRAQIMESSEKHIDFAAKLLDLSSHELKKALLERSMKDGQSEIVYDDTL